MEENTQTSNYRGNERQHSNISWETLKQVTIDTHANNFIEINLKKTPDKDMTYIGISKGWKTDDGEKRYKANILFTKEKKDEIIKAISEIDE